MMLKRKWSNKQYCGDVETDPFDFAYRGSVFEPFKDTNRVPTVAEHTDDFATQECLELIEDIPLPAHRLSAKVRQQYLHYLDKILRNNYHCWLSSSYNPHDNPFTEDEVRQCAETIEMRAVQSCMITSLYRNFLLKKIGEIRKQTTLGVLHPNLTDAKFKPALIKREQCHIGVQTDLSYGDPVPLHMKNNATQPGPLKHVPVMSLEEKMRIFEGSCSVQETRNTQVPSCSWKEVPFNASPGVAEQEKLKSTVQMDVVEAVPQRNDAMDDEILKELQAMFEPADDEANIFEWSEDQEQVKAIISEIENADLEKAQPNLTHASRTEPNTPSPRFNNESKAEEKAPNVCPQPEDLRRSMWPCELHMQRMKLRGLLVRIAEDDYRRYERLVRSQFVTLFGDDDGEEQDLGPYSPSIELNDVLVSSCRQRIAQWVVQALMRPLNDGLIGNRFLFKKLAKRLADNIIYLNQYPDKRFVRNYITDYFCLHSNIKSISDIT